MRQEDTAYCTTHDRRKVRVKHSVFPVYAETNRSRVNDDGVATIGAAGSIKDYERRGTSGSL